MGAQTLLRAGLAIALALLTHACGGGTGGSSGASVGLPASSASLSDPNVALVEVRRGPGGNANIPYVTVTICQSGGVRGTASCQDIPDVLIDTGSAGLRLFASQVRLVLPGQTVGTSTSIYECANFLANNAWGRVQRADVLISGERATAVPIELMDASDSHARIECGGSPLIAPPGSTASTHLAPLDANGILGVGIYSHDGQTYFDCPTAGSGCTRINGVASAAQVQNPVALFGAQPGSSLANNNGVLLQLPRLPAGQAVSAMGYLVFGVGTQSNNQLGAANIVPLNGLGNFSTYYQGTALGGSFFDSGSNALYFPDSSASLAGSCGASAGFFCPANAVTLQADIQLAGGLARVPFTIAAAGSGYAQSTLGGNMPGTSFDWGLPFFFGRSVYTVMEGAVPNAATGSQPRPFTAFTN